MDGSSSGFPVPVAAADAPRRGLLKSALAPVIAGLAAIWLGNAENAAAKTRKKKKCKKCQAVLQGQPCTSNKDCCANETKNLCAFTFASPSDLVCCGGQGASCSIDDDCCFSGACDGGVCTG
jgi:hypothetical protein